MYKYLYVSQLHEQDLRITFVNGTGGSEDKLVGLLILSKVIYLES